MKSATKAVIKKVTVETSCDNKWVENDIYTPFYFIKLDISGRKLFVLIEFIFSDD